jgi:hypothetical protein
MWIFYKHLPVGTTIRKINKVTLKGCKSRLGLTSLLKRNIIKRTKIIRIKDLETEIIEYHAIVQVDSPATAANIIEYLNGKTINGLRLKPHSYHRRYPSRDRRNYQTAHPSLQERRQSERRRSNLVTKVIEIS